MVASSTPSVNQPLDLRSIEHFRIAWPVLIDIWQFRLAGIFRFREILVRLGKPHLRLLLLWFSLDVTKIQTTKLSILLWFYFHNLYGRTSCRDTTYRVIKWKMHLISWLGTASKLSSRTKGQVVSTRQTESSSAKRHLICSQKQRSYTSHAKEQARYRLCVPRSLSKDPT